MRSPLTRRVRVLNEISLAGLVSDGFFSPKIFVINARQPRCFFCIIPRLSRNSIYAIVFNAIYVLANFLVKVFHKLAGIKAQDFANSKKLHHVYTAVPCLSSRCRAARIGTSGPLHCVGPNDKTAPRKSQFRSVTDIGLLALITESSQREEMF